MRRPVCIALIALAAALAGCKVTSYQVEVRVQEPEQFRAPSMLVYVLLCDSEHPAPEFTKETSIEEWVAKDPKKLYRDLSRAGRARRFVVKPREPQTYTVVFETDKKLRETGQIVAIAQFGDTSSYRNHHDRVRVADRPDQEAYVFVLTPNSLKLLTEPKR